MLFVVRFDRRSGEHEVKRFSEDQRASALVEYRRLLDIALEDKFRDIEVNLFQSRDEATFKQTHARYFLSGAQIAENMIEQLRKTLPK